MPSNATPRRLRAEDILCRKVDPGQWDEDGVLPDAFRDRYDEQSFYLKSAKPPGALLRKFASYPSLRTRFGRPHLDENDLYRFGYRVAEVNYGELAALGCTVKQTGAGNDYGDDGHVNIAGAKAYAEEIAIVARISPQHECVGAG